MGMRTAAAIALVGMLVGSAPAPAQDYPSKPVRVVIPFAAGAGTDLTGRLVAQELSKRLGQQFYIENKPGAAALLGTDLVAKADPDGYTLLWCVTDGLSVLPAVKTVPYAIPDDFAFIASIAHQPYTIAVPPKEPFASMAEFVAYAKANPGKLSYASAGAGNQTHLAAELLNARTGIGAVHVPYKSGAEMVTAVLTDQAQLSFLDVSVLLPLIKEGKLKALAVTASRRHPALPDVPTMMESGIANYNATFWTGILAPAGTSPAIIKTLNDTINTGLSNASVRETIERTGAAASTLSPSEFKAFIAAEHNKWKDAVQLAGIKAE